MPLKVSDGVGAWIKDFKGSKAPQFKGKSEKERRDMALAAYLSAKKEDVKSADKKPQNYTGPDGKVRTRMVPVDKNVVKEDMTFKVDIEGLPSLFMMGNSPGQVKNHLRKLIKQPSMIKGVERQTKHDVKKMYRKKAQGKDIDEAVDSTDTGGAEEVNMAMKQVKAMRHFLDGIEARVKKTGDMEEWYQNKLTKANDYLKTLYSYGKGDDVNENTISELSIGTLKKYTKHASNSNYRASQKYARIAASPTSRKYKDKEMAKQDNIMRKRKAGLAMADKKLKKADEGSCGNVDYGSDKSIKIMKKKTPGEMSEKLTIGKIRKAAYKTGKVLGDVQAVKENRVGKRIVRRAAGKATGKLLGKLFR